MAPHATGAGRPRLAGDPRRVATYLTGSGRSAFTAR
jgi:hypothetical protein